MRSITIKRNTGWIGRALDIQIKINGEKVARVMENQHIEVEIPDEKAYIRATQLGIKSNEIEVKDDDTIEITATWWNRTGFIFSLFILLLMNLIPNREYRISFIIIVSVLYIISTFLFNGFYLNVLIEDNKEKKLEEKI